MLRANISVATVAAPAQAALLLVRQTLQEPVAALAQSLVVSGARSPTKIQPTEGHGIPPLVALVTVFATTGEIRSAVSSQGAKGRSAVTARIVISLASVKETTTVTVAVEVLLRTRLFAATNAEKMANGLQLPAVLPHQKKKKNQNLP